ncbi:MAG TPA: hypothetical protein DDZ80_05255 [Cyanobacteria bacterium UBA8803]|nr:hypothetical protein [Cyanobacteria bacterium UBA9273]HBL57952.1 hypothetical protein [Cyanobacteria bacterium UBA8803]
MFLLLSGEGTTDIGTQDDEIGPMTKFIDNWITPRINYSLIDIGQYTLVTKEELSQKAKSIKSLSKKGKKHPSETRYYYKNARALALLAQEESSKRDSITVIPILFRDADGTASSDRGEWEYKRKSMLKGFEHEGILTGVPMIPKPKSEAWILCALRNNYQNCQQLESESGNDDSPNSLKKQLEDHLDEPATRELLNDQIDLGRLDISKIVDMPSLTAFKQRLDEVLENLGWYRREY